MQEGSKGSGSSRRKPKVTHKVVDTDDDAAESEKEEKNEETPFKTYSNANGVDGQENGQKDKTEEKENEKKNDKDDDGIDVDEKGNPILPEGMTRKKFMLTVNAHV